MATETIRSNNADLSLFNNDGSYTRLGAQLEISRHIIYVPNHKKSLELIAKSHGKNIVPRFPEMPEGIALLSDTRIQIYPEGKKHNNNSHAEYIIDWHRYETDDGRENIIWFSRIPPTKGTSKPGHIHGINPINGRGVFEHYFKVAGVAYMDEEDNRRLMDDYEAVPPNTPHYIEAGEEGALFLILIENVKGIKDEDIHQYPAAI